jgi:hypothetical protein
VLDRVGEHLGGERGVAHRAVLVDLRLRRARHPERDGLGVALEPIEHRRFV